MIFSISNGQRNWSLEFGPDSVLLEVRSVPNESVENSIEIPLSVWNLLESQRLRFMEEALTGGPLTDAERQRPYEVHEILPDVQGSIRGWEGQEIVVDNASTSDSGVATLSPTGTSRTAGSTTSTNLFDLAVNRYGFDHPVFDDDDSTEEDVVEENDDDDSDDDFDNDNKENVPPTTSTPEQGGENQRSPTQLRRSAGVPFGRLENIPQSVFRSLFQ